MKKSKWFVTTVRSRTLASISSPWIRLVLAMEVVLNTCQLRGKTEESELLAQAYELALHSIVRLWNAAMLTFLWSPWPGGHKATQAISLMEVL